MAKKSSESRPVCPKVSKSDFGRNEPCNFGLKSRGLEFFRTMLDTLGEIFTDNIEMERVQVNGMDNLC